MIHRDLKPENILIKKYKKGNEELRIYKVLSKYIRYLILDSVGH
jgi:serine/threonine protein kinase